MQCWRNRRQWRMSLGFRLLLDETWSAECVRRMERRFLATRRQRASAARGSVSLSLGLSLTPRWTQRKTHGAFRVFLQNIFRSIFPNLFFLMCARIEELKTRSSSQTGAISYFLHKMHGMAKRNKHMETR